MRLRHYLFIAGIFLWYSRPLPCKAQYICLFENNQLLAEKKGREPIKVGLTGRLNQPELVGGFRGKGLRTDGYSTWLTIGKPLLTGKTTSVKAEFALETYPTDTAGFLAMGHYANWVAACLDRFGQPMIGLKQNGKLSYYGTDLIIPKFKWVNIGLDRYHDKVELLVNGKVVKSVELLPQMADSISRDTVLAGRDWRTKAVGIFPVNMINGIIDELTISNAGIDRVQTAKLYPEREKKIPVLAIPVTRFAGDFARPQYHLLPAANWTNETHGLIYYHGQYHVFNQKNGANLFLGQINWGHFTSPDLVHWTEQVPALSPEKGYDGNGIWSGCIVNDDSGKPVAFYSAGNDQGLLVAAAYPADQNLLVWKKYNGNPIIKNNPDTFIRKDFHDPMVWKSGGAWYMAVGFGLKESKPERGSLLLYKSDDLHHWKYLHPLFTGDPEKDDSGFFWEMPLFWKLDGKYILLVNKVPTRGKPAVALYWTGDFANEKFMPDNPMPKRLEVINRLLSPAVGLDQQGNTTAIAIIPDETSSRETYARGWTHLYSIPRVWTLENGKIRQQPHPALKQLRSAKQDLAAQTIDTASNLLLTTGHQLEISVDLIPGKSKKFGLVIAKNAAGTEFTRIYFDLTKQQLIVDQTKSSQRKYLPLQVRTGSYNLDPSKKLNIHLFIDGSVVEGFINNEDAFTTRIFPLNGESDRVELFTESAPLQILEATVWQMKSAGTNTAF
jgi:beta-fructofuranosidase